MDLNIAAAWLALGKLRSEDAITAASSALDRGVYADKSLLIFVGLASEWEDDVHHRPAYEAEIIEEARQLVSAKTDEP